MPHLRHDFRTLRLLHLTQRGVSQWTAVQKHSNPSLLAASSLATMDPTKTPPQQKQQIIQDRYIDQRRLQALLARNFTPGTYTMTVGLHPAAAPGFH